MESQSDTIKYRRIDYILAFIRTMFISQEEIKRVEAERSVFDGYGSIQGYLARQRYVDRLTRKERRKRANDNLLNDILFGKGD